MKKLLSAFAVTGLLLGGSVVQAGATICSGACVNLLVAGTGNFFDFSPTPNSGIQFLDQYLFTLPGPPPPSYNSFTDAIDALVPINNLGLSIIRVSDSAVIGSATGAAIGTSGESVTLTLTNLLLPSVAYYVQVTGDWGPAIGYSGLQNVTASTPIPAALPLFATGLGLFGFWGRRRKAKSGSTFVSREMVAC